MTAPSWRLLRIRSVYALRHRQSVVPAQRRRAMADAGWQNDRSVETEAG